MAAPKKKRIFCLVPIRVCEMCKYKSLTAIPDFKNDDILFIYGAMACYTKKGNLAPNARRWTVF